MKTIRERFKKEMPPVELPYLELPPENGLGLAPGKYVSVEAIAIAADELNSDDLRWLWETVTNWSGVADEVQRFLVATE